MNQDNIQNRGINRDGDFTSLSSFQYQDIKEGTVELTGFTQSGGSGNPITLPTFASVRGNGYTISAPSISDTDIQAFIAATGVVPVAARSFDLSFVVNFSQAGSLNLPSPNATLEIPSSATAAAGVTINSSSMLVNSVGRNTMTVHMLLEIWGSSDGAIYDFLALWLGLSPRANFIVKIAKS